ncbi:hypothetical protein JT362_17365 [Actinophytocola sp. S1-96]|uniref:Uncharacterized protein n=1 Tax=Actinophytocola gossypii TaxID=2812003 RepID=A0ABT2JAJ2_9PSEU|nr:hypothetical protein [Actinophytocola gossypii]MCT2584886.1 hypothetical protein [Actinophytocola gossypii]
MWRRFFGGGVPAEFTGELDPEEHVVATARLRGGGHLFASSLGLWVPTDDNGPRRVGWHLISKATWGNGTLELVEAVETGTAGEAVLLTDQRPVRYVLEQANKLPDAVHARVNGSIRSRHRRELPGGGAWFVQRKVPGRDGVVLQVRADPGTDEETVRRVAAEVAAKIRDALQ